MGSSWPRSRPPSWDPGHSRSITCSGSQADLDSLPHSDRQGGLDSLVPKLVTTLQGYSRDQFVADLGAGVIVGIVALPLAIAFAIASGVTPERGLYTAIVAGVVVSALRGSRRQIGRRARALVLGR